MTPWTCDSHRFVLAAQIAPRFQGRRTDTTTDASEGPSVGNDGPSLSSYLVDQTFCGSCTWDTTVNSPFTV